MAGEPFRVLSLDGGGAKGFYALGVLHELEAFIGSPLHQSFHLIYGTSTGAIIAALVALGNSVADVHKLYKEHVPRVMGWRLPSDRSRALHSLAVDVFGDAHFDAFKTDVGIVATHWVQETPFIFKTSVDHAFGRKGTFTPGFGSTIAEAVEASCSAVPFFKRKVVTTGDGSQIVAIDGGYCANNPTLYAIADATHAGKRERSLLRVVNIGVGSYPPPRSLNPAKWALKQLPSTQLLEKTLDVNTTSMEVIRQLLFADVAAVRVSDTYETPDMATDMLENDSAKLDLLFQRGRQSFGRRESELRALLG